jgi:hypothetical protein
MALEWLPLDRENCSVTKCGRYSVSTHGGTWQAWRLAPGGPWFAPLNLKLPDEAAARAIAQADADAKAAT